MNNAEMLGIVLSFVYVFLVIGISSKIHSEGNELSRKFIHIMVSNWWLLAMIFFQSPLYATIVPLTFILLNYISYRFKVFGSMERADKDDEGLGTVYYAISLTLLTAVCFRYDIEYIGAMAILIMGYGDGLAALVGKRFPFLNFKRKYSRKSLGGSLTMLFISLLVAFLVLFLSGHYSPTAILAVALAATVLEAISPKGLDNLTVPLGVFGFYFILFYM